MNSIEAAEIVYALHTSYPQDRKATLQDIQGRIDLFSTMFADFDVVVMKQAVAAWLKGNTFMPTPAELLTYAKLFSTVSGAKFITPDDPEITPAEEEYLENLVEWVYEDFD